MVFRVECYKMMSQSSMSPFAIHETLNAFLSVNAAVLATVLYSVNNYHFADDIVLRFASRNGNWISTATVLLFFAGFTRLSCQSRRLSKLCSVLFDEAFLNWIFSECS